jgi:Tfp pilus assembly protein PilF
MSTKAGMRTGVASGRVVEATIATVLVIAGLTGCDISKEPPPGGDPKVLARAELPAAHPGSTEPSDPGPAAMTATTPAPPASEMSSITYGDAERVYRQGRYVEAAELFSAYTVRKPGNVWGHYMLGISAWKAGDHERAETALRRAIELDPRHEKAHVNLGRIFLEENRAAAALDFAEEAVAIAPESAEAWRVLGNVRAALGVVDDAVEAYRHALVLNERDAWTMNNLGLLMIREGRYEEALPALARATELQPRVATFQNNLGIALEHTGHLLESADAFRAALDVQPDHDRAQESLARVELRIVDGDWSPVDLPGLAGAFADEIQSWRKQRAH